MRWLAFPAKSQMAQKATCTERPHLARSGNWPKQAEQQCQQSAIISKRQFADVDGARSCPDCNLELIWLYDVCDGARAVRYNVDTVPASQAVVEQARAT